MVAFKDLWYRHPANNSTQYPCVAPHGLTNMEGLFVPQGFPVFGNQCSIRMGVCLKLAGVSPGSLRQPTCNVHAAEEMHYIRAAELARGACRCLDRRRGKSRAYHRHRGLALLLLRSSAARASSTSRTTGSATARRRHGRPHRCLERLSLLDQVADGMVLLARLLLQLRTGKGSLVLGGEVGAGSGLSSARRGSMRYLIAMAWSPSWWRRSLRFRQPTVGQHDGGPIHLQ